MLQYLVQFLFPMQYLMRNFCEKNDNSWELLLTVVTELYLKCERAPRSDSERHR